MHIVFLCLRYLRKKRIAFFGTAAVMLCVALLIVITSLFGGFIKAYLYYVEQIGGDLVMVTSAGEFDVDELTRQLETLPSVQQAKAVMKSGGLLYLGKGDVRAVELVGADFQKLAREKIFRQGLLLRPDHSGPVDFSLSPQAQRAAKVWLEKRLGREPQPSEMSVAVIIGIGVLARPDEMTDEYDRDAIRKMLEQLEEPFVIVTGRAGNDTSNGAPKKIVRSCWPVDVVQTGWHLSDRGTVYLPLDYMTELLGQNTEHAGATSQVEFQIRAAQGSELNDVIAAVQLCWSRFANQTWQLPPDQAPQAYVRRTLENPRVMLIAAEIRKQLGIIQLMLGLIFLVASLLIFVILYMVVMQKKREIGIFRTLGISRSAVASVYLGFGLGIGLCGSIFGMALGVWATRHINDIEAVLSHVLGFKIWKSSVYMFTTIPNEVAWSAVGWITLTGIALAGLGALAPAVRAARLLPAETLRCE